MSLGRQTVHRVNLVTSHQRVKTKTNERMGHLRNHLIYFTRLYSRAFTQPVIPISPSASHLPTNPMTLFASPSLLT